MEDGQVNDGQVVFKSDALYLRSMLAKNLDDVQMVVRNGIDDARIANLVEIINLNAQLDQQPHHFDFSESAWIVKKSLSFVELVDTMRKLLDDGLDCGMVSPDHLGIEGVSIELWCT